MVLALAIVALSTVIGAMLGYTLLGFIVGILLAVVSTR